jgi:hypothetical protein
MKNKWFTRIWNVRNKGMSTPYVHVQLGHVDIVFKNDTIIGVETPNEMYRSENYDSSRGITALRLDPANGWGLYDRKCKEVSEEGIIIHVNRLLREQAEKYISDQIKSRLTQD